MQVDSNPPHKVNQFNHLLRNHCFKSSNQKANLRNKCQNLKKSLKSILWLNKNKSFIRNCITFLSLSQKPKKRSTIWLIREDKCLKYIPNPQLINKSRSRTTYIQSYSNKMITCSINCKLPSQKRRKSQWSLKLKPNKSRKSKYKLPRMHKSMKASKHLKTTK